MNIIPNFKEFNNNNKINKLIDEIEKGNLLLSKINKHLARIDYDLNSIKKNINKINEEIKQ